MGAGPTARSMMLLKYESFYWFTVFEEINSIHAFCAKFQAVLSLNLIIFGIIPEFIKLSPILVAEQVISWERYKRDSGNVMYEN
jgi:hypothetical protein